ncbi:MAG TPA: polysaccharide biosynthesis tyrosine autokinase [Candidatus Baltobacteraceae bacterium]|nr:polysaccharide biosynthesis tyrosine autokinase [Candidatus Baltobacteraceae bacterium]
MTPQITPWAHANALSQIEDLQAGIHGARDGERLYWAILKRWRLFLTIAFGFVALVGIATFLVPKSYTTKVQLLAGRSDTSTVDTDKSTNLPILNALVLESGVQSAETLAALAQQRDTAAAVTDRLALGVSPNELLNSVKVHPVVNTALLDLSVTWRSAEESARIANAFAEAFIEQERDFVRIQAETAIGFLSNELPDAEAKMRAAASRLAQFQSEHGYIDATAHGQDMISRVAVVDQKLDQLKVDESEAAALLKSAESQLGRSSSTIDSAVQVQQNPVASNLRAKLADVETQLADAEERYTPAHPQVIALRSQRQALIAQIAAQPSQVVGQTTVAPNPLYQALTQQAATYSARIQGDRSQARALEAQRKSYDRTVSQLPQEAVQFAAIQEDAKRSANVYNALAQKYNDAQIAKATAISDLVIAQPASAQAAVRSPNLVINLAVALIVGILLAMSAIYVLDTIDRRRVNRGLAAYLGLPIVARIPAFDAVSRRMLPWVQSMTVEAFLHLCVALGLKNGTVRTLAVLSGNRGEGKSTIAHHLAKSLAQLQPGVLLIDADLRRPTLHEKIPCECTPTLADVLAEKISPEDAVQHVAPGLHVLASSPGTADSVQLLQSGLDALLAWARQKYAMVIVDTPALPAVSDGFIVATKVDGSLLVVKENTSDEKTRIAVAHLRLMGIQNILGIVLNNVAVERTDYHDYLAPIPTPALRA